MEENSRNPQYEALKIPARQTSEGGAVSVPPQEQTDSRAPLSDGLFYEIEYGSCPIEGVGKFVLKPQKIEAPEKDEIRELFLSMREIARAIHPAFRSSRTFDRTTQTENSRIFYKQGMLMKDFTDEYTESVPYSSYFPYYQMMGYEQLRTYFTWRTAVRNGEVRDTSLSYAFLYLYELVNNIGVDSPQEGLDKLVAFWNAYRVYDKRTDKYVLRWLKDYHVYYELPQSFYTFLVENNLTKHYPKVTDTSGDFNFFCALSKYDIRKSAFCTEEKRSLIADCFFSVLQAFQNALTENGLSFEKSVFQPTKKMTIWIPFKDALFFPWKKQTDRRVVFAENESYVCKKNVWTFHSSVIAEDGRQLIGYLMKQTEAVLRAVTKYKYKLSTNLDTVSHPAAERLKQAGLRLDKLVEDAVMACYREATKTVVSVDIAALTKIRLEALETQEKLIVPEKEVSLIPTPVPLPTSAPIPAQNASPPPTAVAAPASDPWAALKEALSETEWQAVLAILRGEPDIRQFAEKHGVMLEVLMDGINEKAMDFIGDNLLDEEFAIYEDYINETKGMVE